MKFTLASLALPLLAASAPTPEPATNPAFTVMAMRSASPIHFLQMNAVGQKFWLGGKTTSYCPEQVEPNCPPGDQTVFAPGGSSLDTMVPGGQQVYIDPNGALSFTQAHSANIPQGSSRGPFQYAVGDPWSHYTFNGWGASGFMACPADDNRWQVFAAIQNATVPHGNVDECLGFSATAITYEGDVPAWQYI
ncbi:uncharacterized protein N7479_003822 [Penicillium vulpinum]|uniref:IgE-binding protein n=1 Tax=Penicillium vulpinum TaxID=29845 RepID=A0A1V6RGF0_9EURO|nr:uncharacterized protein N7479_003822 [Penicillium vulpinum]KAJ5963946.1 hypothetical protein N7479_003822 [Penicillium vulpinum]OQE00519.1 hypothetical protein PENVUL_c050G06296 [Penicillium vulpinum]